MAEETTRRGRRRPGGRPFWLVLAYAGPLCLVPLVANRQDPEVRWHSRHGLVLLVHELALGALFLVVGGVTSWLWGPAALGFAFAAIALAIALVVLHALLALAALEGIGLRIPGVSRHADRL